jgi:hypothetical protein
MLEESSATLAPILREQLIKNLCNNESLSEARLTHIQGKCNQVHTCGDCSECWDTIQKRLRGNKKAAIFVPVTKGHKNLRGKTNLEVLLRLIGVAHAEAAKCTSRDIFRS